MPVFHLRSTFVVGPFDTPLGDIRVTGCLPVYPQNAMLHQERSIGASASSHVQIPWKILVSLCV